VLYKPSLAQISGGGHRGHPRYRGCMGHWMCNEGAGLNAYDVSGNGWTGVLTGGPTWDVGQFGGAINFDGTNDYVTIPDRPFPIQELTVSVWVNEAENGVIQPYVTKWSLSAGAQRSFELLRSTDNKYYLSVTATSTGDVWFGSTAAFTTDTIGVWHHIVGVWRGATPQIQLIYRDGAPLPGTVTGSTPATMFDSTTPVYLGSENLGDFYKGKLDDVRIYNRALDAQEIQSLYRDPFLEFRRYQPPVIVEIPPSLAVPQFMLLGVGR